MEREVPLFVKVELDGSTKFEIRDGVLVPTEQDSDNVLTGEVIQFPSPSKLQELSGTSFLYMKRDGAKTY